MVMKFEVFMVLSVKIMVILSMPIFGSCLLSYVASHSLRLILTMSFCQLNFSDTSLLSLPYIFKKR
jgi:hypothetical protein